MINLRKCVKYLHHKTFLGYILIHPVKIFLFYLKIYFLPEKLYVKNVFCKHHKYKLNLKNPRTLNEKIQWLKLFDRKPIHTLCADKYQVRDYISEKIGPKYLIPIVFHTKKYAELVPENIPDYPVIIKTSHDSLSKANSIVFDKNAIDWNQIQKKFKKLLKRNYYYATKEWQYKNIEPRVIIEKLLLDSEGNLPNDYKMHCFNGKVTFIQVDKSRREEMNRNLYDINWQMLSCRLHYKNGPLDERPNKLDDMVKLAETVAAPFYYVRVDLYYVNNEIYFGEMTFHPGSGLKEFYPFTWDEKFGDMLMLPV